MKVEEFSSVLFIINVRQEHATVVGKIGILAMAAFDKNSDPTFVDLPIMCYNDSIKEIRMIIYLLIEGIQEGISLLYEKKSFTRKYLRRIWSR